MKKRFAISKFIKEEENLLLKGLPYARPFLLSLL
jgi:hypothetical protein